MGLKWMKMGLPQDGRQSVHLRACSCMSESLVQLSWQFWMDQICEWTRFTGLDVQEAHNASLLIRLSCSDLSGFMKSIAGPANCWSLHIYCVYNIFDWFSGLNTTGSAMANFVQDSWHGDKCSWNGRIKLSIRYSLPRPPTTQLYNTKVHTLLSRYNFNPDCPMHFMDKVISKFHFSFVPNNVAMFA